jgi:hypothetical protein
MSALPSTADIHQGDGYVSFVTSRQSEFHALRLRRLARERELTGINACDDIVPISKEVPVRISALAILAIGMVSAAGQARAQTYDPAFPVCMHVVVWGGPYEDCSYFTLAQCAMSASGRAAQCNINPYYAGATASPGRNDRRHRRVY